MRGYLTYLIALGSNRRHPRHGDPRHVLAAALRELAETVTVTTAGPVIATPPLGPSRRRYANTAALIETPLAPPELLRLLKHIERSVGRRPGQRWAARVLDLDIVLWSGGRWHSGRAGRADHLHIPHPHYRQRTFVLTPAARIAPRWRDPVTGLSLRQLAVRLRKPATPAPAAARS